jgi:hypothetical protein
MHEGIWVGRRGIQDSIVKFYVEVVGVCTNESLDVFLAPVGERMGRCEALVGLALSVVRERRDLSMPMWILRIGIEQDLFEVVETWFLGRDTAYKSVCEDEEVISLMFGSVLAL